MVLPIRLHPPKEMACPQASSPLFSFKRLGGLIVFLGMVVGLGHNALASLTASLLGAVRSLGAALPQAKVTEPKLDTPNVSSGSFKSTNPRASNNDYFDTSTSSAAPVGRLGTARRKFISGPELDNYTMSLVMNTPFVRRCTLHFRAELFNQHPQFPAMSGNFNPPTSGKTTVANDSRIG
jgi:hypothetical protein